MRFCTFSALKKTTGTWVLLLLLAITGRSQSICPTCPVLQGLPDTIPACKQATFAMPVPFITGIQAGTTFYDTAWTATPPSGASISNPFAAPPNANLLTNVTVAFQPVMIKLRIRTIRPSITANGDFTLGNNGSFTSGHTYNASSVGSAGTYAITTSPVLVNPIYTPFGDHTSGSGNMMVINGSTAPNTAVWCQTYNVDACADYRFDYWAASATSVNPAVLRVRINGLVSGGPVTTLSPIPATWLPTTEFITSRSTGTMQVCLYNSTVNNNGNDFALDDISFRPMCRLEDSSYIPVTNLRPLILSTINQGCVGDTVIFKADTQNFPGIPASLPDSWSWDFGDGSSSTQANPTHIYTQQGVYNVNLRVYRTSTYGTQSVTCVDSAKGQVDTRHPFYAGFTQDKDTICKGEIVTFTDTSGPASARNSFNIVLKYGDGDTSIQDPNGIKIYKHAYDSVGLFTVSMIATDYLGCTDTAYGSVLSVGQPPVSFTTSDTAFCVGGTTIVDATVPPTYTSFAWNFGDGRIVVDSEEVRHAYVRGGVYRIKFTATHPVCPAILAYDTVTVYDLPQVNLGSDTSLCPMGLPVRLQNTTANPLGTRYLWNTGDATPDILVRHDGDFWLTATSGTNCQSTDSVHIAKNCYLDIPNAFAPGGSDNSSSYFLPRQLLGKSLRTFKMQIFNRYGQIIYQTTRLDGRGWDGKYNGVDQPMGAYLYFIDATFDNSASEHYEGNVTLVR